MMIALVDLFERLLSFLRFMVCLFSCKKNTASAWEQVGGSACVMRKMDRSAFFKVLNFLNNYKGCAI